MGKLETLRDVIGIIRDLLFIASLIMSIILLFAIYQYITGLPPGFPFSEGSPLLGSGGPPPSP